MTVLHIERRAATDHEPGRRVLAAGRVEGGVVLMRVAGRDVLPGGRADAEREAGIEVSGQAGRRAWRIRLGQGQRKAAS